MYDLELITTFFVLWFFLFRLDSTQKSTNFQNIPKQNDTYMYASTENKQNKDTYNEDNQQQEDTYADSQEEVYDKAGNRRHKEQKNCEPFDHIGTAQDIRYV